MTEQLLPIPLVLALIELLKGLGLPGRFAPLASVALGFAAAFVLGQAALQGLVIGLSAAGLYSGSKASFGK
jgi:hypothetical protein